jgi:hypothetical protein
MDKKNKLIDNFKKLSDNYNVTNCQNGFLIEISGQDMKEEWITVKFIVNTVEELRDTVQDIAWMPKTQ